MIYDIVQYCFASFPSAGPLSSAIFLASAFPVNSYFLLLS